MSLREGAARDERGHFTAEGGALLTARGAQNGNWNAEGRVITSHGYVRVRVGKDHPLADSKGWAYEHELVWCAAGRVVPPGYLLHHHDENKTHNALSNLRLKLKPVHAREHAQRQPRRNGRFTKHRRSA
jgi:hypothetical protein